MIATECCPDDQTAIRRHLVSIKDFDGDKCIDEFVIVFAPVFEFESVFEFIFAHVFKFESVFEFVFVLVFFSAPGFVGRLWESRPHSDNWRHRFC